MWNLECLFWRDCVLKVREGAGVVDHVFELLVIRRVCSKHGGGIDPRR